MFTWVMYAVQHVDHRSVEYSYCVIVALYAVGLVYPVYLNFVRRARWQVDSVKDRGGLPSQEHDGAEGDGEDRGSSIRRFSRRFSVMFEKIKSAGSGKKGSGEGFVEHR